MASNASKTSSKTSSKTPSKKRLQIDKANTAIVVITSVAAFVTIFSLVAIKNLASQATYQQRILSAKHKAVAQLQDNLQAANKLKTSYQAFVDTPQNIIGGNPSGTGPNDGDNARIILDALPSQYDFPALATSLEKIITSQNLTIQSITGTDEELTQQSSQSSSNSAPIAMPFEVSVTGNYTAIQGLINAFEHSVRPFQIQTMTLSGDESNLTADITAQTFYQPAGSFTIGSEVIK